jgi:hypothetical protein
VKRRARVPSQLPESLHKQVNAYALAASAAGVGVLALAQPAEARIIYAEHIKAGLLQANVAAVPQPRIPQHFLQAANHIRSAPKSLVLS